MHEGAVREGVAREVERGERGVEAEGGGEAKRVEVAQAAVVEGGRGGGGGVGAEAGGSVEKRLGGERREGRGEKDGW